jgi:hypothetical protein
VRDVVVPEYNTADAAEVYDVEIENAEEIEDVE